jgi:excisionase family DNA binding protein
MYDTAGLTSRTFKKALDGLQRCGLIFVSEGERTNALVLHLCDPFTGEPMHTPDRDDRTDSDRYTTTDGRNLPWNGGTDDDWEQIVRDSVPAGQPISKQPNGDVMIRCPFHDDRTPSCSVSLRLRCYHCFGCGKAGTLRTLLAKLTGFTNGGARPRIARELGKEVAFHEPDSNAIARYDYLDARGVPVKQVLRLPDDEHGKKQFLQRRWTPNGWSWNVKGVGPVLYNAHRIATAGTVVIVEGEKDADSITNLHLCGYGGETIGVTSGGSGSWHPKLAKQLRNKVVIVMPDNDAPGERFAEAVRNSLDAENIEHKTVSFAGTGAKDVTDYLANGHTAEELVQLVNSDWVTLNTIDLQAAAEDFEPLLSAEEATELLPIHPNTLRLWARQGKIRCYRVGRRRFFRASDINRYLDAPCYAEPAVLTASTNEGTAA